MFQTALTIPFLSLVLQAVASPVRTNDVLVKGSPTPAIDARVIDHDGLDITSSFQVMLYDERKDPTVIANLTDRRRQAAELSRPIIECPIPNAVFIDSMCTYGDNQASG